MFIIICFVNEYFVQNSSINQVKLGKNVRKWRDFYNPYCTVQVLFPRQLTTWHAANNYYCFQTSRSGFWKVWWIFQAASLHDDRIDAEVTTAMLPISVRYLCRKSKFHRELSRWLKRFMMLTVFSVNGEDLQHRCFRKEHYVKTVTRPDMDPVFGNNFCIQFQRRNNYCIHIT